MRPALVTECRPQLEIAYTLTRIPRCSSCADGCGHWRRRALSKTSA